jgi:magnesium chelatase family protein
MFARVLSAAVLGIEAYVVKVETHLESGIPHWATVGLPEGAVKESKERVSAAVKNSGFRFPSKRITVNLAPADIRKEGSAFDLSIAVGLLAAIGEVDPQQLEEYILLGELALDGNLRSIHGALPIAVEVQKHGFKGIIVPEDNASEAAMATGIDVYPVSTLREAVELLNGESIAQPFTVDIEEVFRQGAEHVLDFSDVKGQELAKRALEIAAAGRHNIIMIGPPGSGKSMLAKRLPTVLPKLTLQEALETTKIHSVAGLLPAGTPLITTRPFRSPHHTISDAGLIGGGQIPRAGEVSLAHFGVLFLDELTEFKNNVLEVMRQPLEEGSVTLSRAAISLTYPANFMLASAMNPCPCGYATDNRQECTCTTPQIQRYLAKVSGPLLDRIDIHIEVPAVEYKDLAGNANGESSSVIRTRVEAARSVQNQRFADHPDVFFNADMEQQELREYCALDDAGQELLKQAITKLGLSARAYDRILKVARTIADLEDSETIQPAYVAEAIQYRSLDRNLWSG